MVSWLLALPFLAGSVQAYLIASPITRRRQLNETETDTHHDQVNVGNGSRRLPGKAMKTDEADGKAILPRPWLSAQHDMSRKNILLAWTPRAGCSFVMEIWFRFLGCYDAAFAYNENPHNYRQDIIMKDPNGGAAAEADLRAEGNFKFKVVMDPYHRAVAMYEHAAETLLREHDFSFIEFLQYLETHNEQDEVRENPIRGFGFHYATQVALETNDSGMYDIICKIEDMDACISNVNSITGLNFALPPTDSPSRDWHNHEHQHVEGDVPNTRYSKIREDVQIPLSTDFYLGESGQYAANLVQRLYRYDFEAYGYVSNPTDVPEKVAKMYDRIRSQP